MEGSGPTRRPRAPAPFGHAARAVCHWLWRLTVSSIHALRVVGCCLAAIPVDDPGAPAPAPAPAPVSGVGPPPGHPERVGAEALTEAEIEIWARIGGVARWPL